MKFLSDRRLINIILANIISSIGTGITGTAIPWLLLNYSGGEVIYGYTYLFTTIAVFILTPFIGSFIDKYSRKDCLLLSQGLGLLFILPFTIHLQFSSQLSPWELVIIQIGGFFYWSIQVPSLFAYTHELFSKEVYRQLNSTMEIQSQAASMLSAGLASILINQISVSTILIIDCFTYLISIALVLSLPRISNLQRMTNQPTPMALIREGFHYVRSIPMLGIFFICSFSPFVGVMVGNYLNPVHIIKTLEAPPNYLGISSLLYAIGAAGTGIFMTWLMKKVNPYYSSLISVFIYTLSLWVIAIVPSLALFLVTRVTMGLGNSGARIASNTLMMEVIPNAMIGRVNSFMNGFNLGLRALLIFIFTNSVFWIGTQILFGILGMFMSVSVLLILIVRNKVISELKNSNLPKQKTSS